MTTQDRIKLIEVTLSKLQFDSIAKRDLEVLLIKEKEKLEKKEINMGIWVISQNKEILIECNLINCCRLDGTEHLLQCDSDNRKNVHLGVYSTKEKALKVLDMIRKHIECADKQTIQTNEDEWLHYNANVFQMPQDNEVEV